MTYAIAEKHTAKATLDQIFSGLLAGLTLRKAVEAAGVTLTEFRKALANSKDAAIEYARTLELRADLMVDDAIELADGDGDPGKVRNQVDIRKWTATKHHSKRYGERIDLNVAQTLDIGSTLLEARSRMQRPISYLQDVSDVQTREFIGVSEHGAHDKQSLSVHLDVPKEGAEPDIFS